MIYTSHNTDLNKLKVNSIVKLKGWVSKKRNLGGLIFIDLRDKTGIIQLVVDPESSQYEKAQSLKNEYVVNVEGKVVERKAKNPILKTGDIEIEVINLEILNTAQNPPIIIQDNTDALEETRLKYRYLDLRRPIQKQFIIDRHRIVQSFRKAFLKEEFFEIETPILSKSTPEGARDYLVPSRIYKGEFFALPQSPQIYKQLLMIAGFERYFQFARSFRDEDLRADRQPEFTQIDVETSFLTIKEIHSLIEKIFRSVFKEILNVKLSKFPKLTYKKAISLYGSDKPDTRFDMFIKDYNFLKKSDNKLLSSAKYIRGIIVNKADSISRKKIDEYTKLVNKNGAKTLAYIKYDGIEYSGSVSKIEKEFLDKLNLSKNDILLLVCDYYSKASKALGALRNDIAHEFNLINKDLYNFLWIVDFPLFERDEETNKLVSMQHPFTAPKDFEMLKKDPANAISKGYDLVLNGYELGSGSIRIFNQEVQRTMFDILGLTSEDIDKKFGFLTEALKYGTPPHGGIGLGLERIVMLMTNTTNIKDVVAFPRTQSTRDLMNESPSKIDKQQLDDLGIYINEKES